MLGSGQTTPQDYRELIVVILVVVRVGGQQRVGTNRESTGSAAEKLERAEFQLGKFGMGAASVRIYFFFPRGFP